MVTRTINRGLLAAFAASALALVFAVLMGVSTASAADNAVSLVPDASTVAPGATVVVKMNVAPATGVTVGGIVSTITYDANKLTVASCKPSATCNTTVSGTITVANTDLTNGLSAGAATVTFTVAANAAAGTTPIGLTVTQCKADDGTTTLSCPGTGTTLTIAVATAVPTAAPTGAATAAPTATAAALPKSGGPLGDSSSMSLGWLLGAAGLMVVAGGAWTLARARREEN